MSERARNPLDEDEILSVFKTVTTFLASADTESKLCTTDANKTIAFKFEPGHYASALLILEKNPNSRWARHTSSGSRRSPTTSSEPPKCHFIHDGEMIALFIPIVHLICVHPGR